MSKLGDWIDGHVTSGMDAALRAQAYEVHPVSVEGPGGYTVIVPKKWRAPPDSVEGPGGYTGVTGDEPVVSTPVKIY